jgi:hypothetical protein
MPGTVTFDAHVLAVCAAVGAFESYTVSESSTKVRSVYVPGDECLGMCIPVRSHCVVLRLHEMRLVL